MFNITELWINRQPALSGGNNWNDNWLSSSRSCKLSRLWINRCSALCAASGFRGLTPTASLNFLQLNHWRSLGFRKKNATSIPTAHLKETGLQWALHYHKSKGGSKSGIDISMVWVGVNKIIQRLCHQHHNVSVLLSGESVTLKTGLFDGSNYNPSSSPWCYSGGSVVASGGEQHTHDLFTGHMMLYVQHV